MNFLFGFLMPLGVLAFSTSTKSLAVAYAILYLGAGMIFSPDSKTTFEPALKKLIDDRVYSNSMTLTGIAMYLVFYVSDGGFYSLAYMIGLIYSLIYVSIICSTARSKLSVADLKAVGLYMDTTLIRRVVIMISLASTLSLILQLKVQ